MEDTFSYLCIKFTQNEHLFITITHEKTAWIKIIVGVHENIIDKGGEKKSLRNLGEPHCTLYH